MLRPDSKADVAHVFEITGEDYDGEGTGDSIFTEIQEVNAFVAHLHLQNFSFDAFGFADVLGGFVDGEAVGGWEPGRQGQRHQHRY